MTHMTRAAGRSGKTRKLSREARTGTHSCATTTPSVRRAIQESEETNIVLAKRYGVNRKTIAKWKAREVTSDERMGPKARRSSLGSDDEIIILAYRWHTRLALNDLHLRLRHLIPNLTRSTLHRCLKRHGLSRVGRTAKCPLLTPEAVAGPYTFEIAALTVTFYDDPLDHSIGMAFEIFLAIEEVTKRLYAEVAGHSPENAAAFLAHLVDQSPQDVFAVTTDIRPVFTDWRAGFNENMAAVSPHPFAVACRDRGVPHIRSIPPATKPTKIRSRAVEIR